MMQEQAIPQDQAGQIAKMVALYNRNPKAFTPDQAKMLVKAAQELNLPMDIPSDPIRTVGNLVYGAADAATFGLLPDVFVDSVTKGDAQARNIGGFLGMFGGPMIAGKMASKALAGKFAAMKAAGAATGVAEAASAAAPELAAGKANLNMLQKAFSSIKEMDFLKAAAEKPAVQKAMQDAVRWGIQMGAGQAFSDPGAALTQGAIGAAFGGVSGYRGAAKEAAAVAEGEAAAAPGATPPVPGAATPGVVLPIAPTGPRTPAGGVVVPKAPKAAAKPALEAKMDNARTASASATGINPVALRSPAAWLESKGSIQALFKTHNPETVKAVLTAVVNGSDPKKASVARQLLNSLAGQGAQ